MTNLFQLYALLHNILWDQKFLTKNTDDKWECFNDILNNCNCQGISMGSKYKSILAKKIENL